MGLIRETRERIYECDQCNKTGCWNDHWLSKLIMHKTCGGWDEWITVCSIECADKYDEAKRKGNRKQHPEQEQQTD